MPEEGKDLNGDGDTEDQLWMTHLLDLEEGGERNLGTDRYCGFVTDNYLVLGVYENGLTGDLNGDGDTSDFVAHVHDLAADTTTNLGLAIHPILFGLSDCAFRGTGVAGNENWLAIHVSERDQGRDLNGDEDTEDGVVHIRAFETNETTNLGLSAARFSLDSESLVLEVLESFQGADLNDDGDLDDNVLHFHDLVSGDTRDLELDGYYGAVRTPWHAGSRIVFQVSESEVGADLNGDMDMVDGIYHIHDLDTEETTNLGLVGSQLALSRDWLALAVHEGDADQRNAVYHIVDFEEEEPRNLGARSLVIFEGTVAYSVWESFVNLDLNGDGDRDDAVIQLMGIEPAREFLRADCNDDGGVDISDAVCTLEWLFLGRAEPGCVAATNTNGDEAVDVSDPVSLLGFLFLGGPAPVDPFPDCGPGALTADEQLGCANPPNCQ